MTEEKSIMLSIIETEEGMEIHINEKEFYMKEKRS